MYFFPVLMVVVLGIAFRNTTTETFEVDIVDGPYAELTLEKLTDEERLIATIVTEDEARRRLRTGKSSLMITAADGALSEVEYQFDEARPGSAQARDIADRQLQMAMGRTDVIRTKDVQFDEPGGRYIDFLVPGLLGMSLMGGGLWGVGFAIVDMRIRKLLKRFMATPMRRSHFLIGMSLSRLVYMIPQILILLLFSYFVFGVPIYGNIGTLIVLIFLGASVFSAIGLLVAARAKTIETVSGLMNLVMLPMYTLCGIFFSYERFPEFLHPIIEWLPLTPVINSIRAVMLDGKTLASQWPEIGIMIVWTIVPLIVALAIFRWRE
ncbi:MAG: ABC transporter permease [Planctomycetota bacterium]